MRVSGPSVGVVGNVPEAARRCEIRPAGLDISTCAGTITQAQRHAMDGSGTRIGPCGEKVGMRDIDQATIRQIQDLVYDFFAAECDVDRSSLSDSTRIIEELEGDSLMFLSLLEKVRKRYGIGIELKVLARHLMKKPANTIGQVTELSVAIVRHGDDIVNVEL